jgi:hypothetical protein
MKRISLCAFLAASVLTACSGPGGAGTASVMPHAALRYDGVQPTPTPEIVPPYLPKPSLMRRSSKVSAGNDKRTTLDVQPLDVRS